MTSLQNSTPVQLFCMAFIFTQETCEAESMSTKPTGSRMVLATGSGRLKRPRGSGMLQKFYEIHFDQSIVKLSTIKSLEFFLNPSDWCS